MSDNSNLNFQNFKLPILVGPTGVGKSEAAYYLAQKLNADILSADAFQVYRGLEIGTAQPPKEWQKIVTHHLIGILNPIEHWNAVKYAIRARKVIDDCRLNHKRLILVGGSGFYIRALLNGPPEGSAPLPSIREKISAEIKRLGNEKAHEWLEKLDSAAAFRIHPNDSKRICRAIEKALYPTQETNAFEPLGEENVRFLGLERSRMNLDNNLRIRTEMIWKNGLLNEAKTLLELNIPKTHPLWGAIGYSEAVSFLNKEMTEEEAREKIFRRTRQYAKRQWTWFKNQHQMKWINLDDFSNVSEAVNVLFQEVKNLHLEEK